MSAPGNLPGLFSSVSGPLPLGAVADSRKAAPLAAGLPASGGGNLQAEILAALETVAQRHRWILSATFTGSFLNGNGLEGISDIDFVVVVDQLNQSRFETLTHDCETALQPITARAGFALRINPTLGPLKFNDPNTAVLHLMLYSAAAHAEHVVKSPFTCLDWQRSPTYCKQPLAAVYPVFALQPHHFVSARRSISDYLTDFRAGVISYRELACDAAGYQEVRREQPMTVRDRHEFAYHIVRFLMQNVLKLIERHNEALDGDQLLGEFIRLFPLDADDVKRLYAELAAKKKSLDFSWPVPDLNRRLETFVANFEAQFRKLFVTEATRHIVFRHAPTALNVAMGQDRRFVGRSNPEISPIGAEALATLTAAVSGEAKAISAAFVSPLLRCQQTYQQLRAKLPLPEATIDNRLIEIDYGDCEGQTVSIARENHPELFAAWQRGDDPAFPGGEGTDAVARRALAFVDDRWPAADGPTLVCTHNVVLRTIVGHGLRVPRALWHRLQIPHLQPVTVVQTRSYGWFVDLDEAVEGQLFADFANG
ncbi:MAG TPA: histidine phosphatase family protein [Pirellulales bacterium]|jgi:broad specificity phosphatase PhoE